MKALVVYDSFFGNTEKVAQAIGSALGAEPEVNVRRVGDVRAEHLSGLDVLIVGSPTRAFSASPAIKKLVRSVPRNGLEGVQVAAFDTRADVVKVGSRILSAMAKAFGYAAEPIAAILARKGGQAAAPPAGFIVEDTEGPLREGELERAAAWAKQVAAS
jgi:flavodoxin